MHVADLDAEVRRLEALGARRVSASPLFMGTFSWLVMADPEGKAPKAALRALKRRISDTVYRHLVADAERARH